MKKSQVKRFGKIFWKFQKTGHYFQALEITQNIIKADLKSLNDIETFTSRMKVGKYQPSKTCLCQIIFIFLNVKKS